MNRQHPGILLFAAAALVSLGGVWVAASEFPGGFDWVYMVISKLASPAHNPDGARWLAGSMLAAAALLWPVAPMLRSHDGAKRLDGAWIIRVGLVGAAVLGAEALFAIDLSRHWRKGHELVALVTFVAFYAGLIALYVAHLRRSRTLILPALLVIAPLCAVAATQLHLYFNQRGLGWVNTSWRELGIPFWLSFAFWQWTAVAVLGIGIGSLLVLARRRQQ